MGQVLEDDLNECLRPHVAPYLSQSDRRICCICSPERAVPACLASSPPHKKKWVKRRWPREQDARSVHNACVQCAPCVRAYFVYSRKVLASLTHP